MSMTFTYGKIFNVTEVFGIKTSTPYTFTIRCGEVVFLPYYEYNYCGFKTEEEAENYRENMIENRTLESKKVLLFKNMSADNFSSDFVLFHGYKSAEEAYKFILEEEDLCDDDTIPSVISYIGREDSKLTASVVYDYNRYMIKIEQD